MPNIALSNVPTSGDVVVFCDNSNVFIEGQREAAHQDKIRGLNYEFRIDYGLLLEKCANGRDIKQANLYGSVPPPNDSLWKAIKCKGWNVKTFPRNSADKEKGLDMEIGLDMQKYCYENTSCKATMLLLAGDGDYQYLIHRLKQDFQRDVEVWFYDNVAQTILSVANVVSLSNILHTFRLK